MSRPWGAHGLPPGPVVKICGLTQLEDVLLARSLGVWALGFVFASSPRQLTPGEARRLIDLAAAARPPAQAPSGSSGPLTIGVFGDVTAAEVAWVVEHVGLDGVQLHGRAGPAAADVREALTGWVCPRALWGAWAADGASVPTWPVQESGQTPLIIRAVPVTPDGTGSGALRHAITAAGEEADLVLLDTRSAGQFGGTGTAFPWRLAREAGECAPLLVAGGIDAENVQTALEESGAWGVDVSSGVESSPGQKDARLVGHLLARVEGMRDAISGRKSTNERQEGPRT